MLLAAVLVVAALAAVAYEEVSRRSLAAAAALAAPGPAFLAGWLVEGPFADLAVDPAGCTKHA